MSLHRRRPGGRIQTTYRRAPSRETDIPSHHLILPSSDIEHLLGLKFALDPAAQGPVKYCVS